MLRGHAEEGVGMRKVLDWKFFLRVAVAVTALTLFLSAALAGEVIDGDEIISEAHSTRKVDVKLEQAKLAFLRKHLREHKEDFEKYMKATKNIEVTLKIGETQYV